MQLYNEYKMEYTPDPPKKTAGFMPLLSGKRGRSQNTVDTQE
jgi:hypothetical protein